MSDETPEHKTIEYWIHEGVDGENLDFLDGREWRKAYKLAEECEQGLHPEITGIERVVRYPNFNNDYETLYKKEDGNE